MWILVLGLKRDFASGVAQTRSDISDSITSAFCPGLPAGFLELLPNFACLGQQTCKYICQKDGPKSGPKARGNYVSLYSTKYKMSVFSAAVIKDTYKNKGPRDKSWEDDTIRLLELPFQTGSMEHFEAFSEYHRGHLFPYQFAESDEQGVATNRLSNAASTLMTVSNAKIKDSKQFSSLELFLLTSGRDKT